VTNKAPVLAILCMVFLLQACSDTAMSREDEIKQLIETAVETAENRNSDDLSGLIDENYLDEKGLGKKQLIGLVRLYFFRHKNIYLFSKIDAIEFIAENEAQVTLHVAMAGSVISDASVLSSLRARIYKFELALVKREEWLLQWSRWRAASVGDMQ